MSASRNPRPAVRAAAAAALLAALLGGCAYDYTQRTDRVSHSAGNAVKANLEAETVNPSGRARYSTTDLGKNGVQIPQ